MMTRRFTAVMTRSAVVITVLFQPFFNRFSTLFYSYSRLFKLQTSNPRHDGLHFRTGMQLEQGIWTPLEGVCNPRSLAH
jgi:hypothetical protein